MDPELRSQERLPCWRLVERGNSPLIVALIALAASPGRVVCRVAAGRPRPGRGHGPRSAGTAPRAASRRRRRRRIWCSGRRGARRRPGRVAGWSSPDLVLFEPQLDRAEGDRGLDLHSEHAPELEALATVDL